MRFYRLLLHLYPAAFRAEYAIEMEADFERRRRETNPAWLWLDAIADALATSARVHADLLQQDLRWTLRTLRQSPGFTLTAIVVAALGIGANTAAFTLLDHVLLRPLPFSEPDRLMVLYQDETANGYPRGETSPLNFRDWRAMNKSFETMSAYRGLSVNLAGQGEPARVEGASITADLLSTLRVQPALGRAFTSDDDREGAAGTVLLSDHLWRSMFGADPSVLGRTIRLDEQPYTIVGVMPEGFLFPSRDAQLWTAMRFAPPDLIDRANLYLHLVARLRPGVPIEQARAEMQTIAAQLERAWPKDLAHVGAAVVPMRDVISTQSRMLVLAVFGAALCVMLIACMNQANLLLARGMARKREIAVRIAIGAGRERLVRQLLTENLVLSITGGAVGLLLAWIATPTLSILVPGALPIGGVPQMDLRVFAFAAVLTVVTSIVFGAVPALRACGQADMDELRGRSAGTGRPTVLRSALVIAEVAGTVTLLVGAGLLVKTLHRIQAVDPGFRADGVLTLRTVLPMPKYNRTALREQFYSNVLTEARALPGVTSAAYISFLPMVMRGGIWPVEVPGFTGDPASARVSMRFVTPGFFETLKIPILSGRDIAPSDRRDSEYVAIVSESFVRRYWPGQNPLGRHLNITFFDRTVVGVVADIAVRGLEHSSEPQVYIASPQISDGAVPWYAPKDLVIRSAGNPAALAPALRQIIHRADAELPVTDVRTLSEIVGAETTSRRAQLGVIGVFTILAFVLAAVGIHGLMAFAVSTRAHEVGVRMALGAQRADILRMFLSQGLLLGIAGLLAALPLAYAAARAMDSLLFAVKPADPSVYLTAAALALAMTLAGSLVPAVRAARIDPASSMRAD